MKAENKPRRGHKTTIIEDADTREFGLIVWLGTKKQGVAEVRARKFKDEYNEYIQNSQDAIKKRRAGLK